MCFLFYSFNVAIKSVKYRTSTTLNVVEDKCNPNIPVESSDHDVGSENNDIASLMDEAKTMFSVGAYHENIVNLQGVTYTADVERKTLLAVRYNLNTRACSHIAKWAIFEVFIRLNF